MAGSPILPEGHTVDWEALAYQLDLIRHEGSTRFERGGGEPARQALVSILGEEVLLDAADYYISGGPGAPGAELARSVLRMLYPVSVMERCRQVCRESSDREDRRAALDLLKVVADARVLAWIPEFLADPDEVCAVWAIDIVDQMIMSRRADLQDCESVLALADVHDNQQVRDKAAWIREHLKD